MYHDAAGIISDLLRTFSPKCRNCRCAATRVATPRAIIIGDNPLLCDSCKAPDGWVVKDLPQAELIRAAEKYLDTNAMKT